MASTSEGERRDYNRLVALLHHQRRAIAALEAENLELTRKLNDLRRGVGISVTIHGQTMSLTSPVVTVVNQSTEPPDPAITGTFPIIVPTAPESPAGRPSDSELHRRPNRPATATSAASRQERSGAREYRDPRVTPRTPDWLRDEAVTQQWPSLNTPRVPNRHPTSGRYPISKPVELP